jgi:hypothetical protein
MDEADMTTYETPTVTELGSVADFTSNDKWALAFDGFLLHRETGGGGPQTS